MRYGCGCRDRGTGNKIAGLVRPVTFGATARMAVKSYRVGNLVDSRYFFRRGIGIRRRFNHAPKALI